MIKGIGLHSDRIANPCSNLRERRFVEKWNSPSFRDILAVLFRKSCHVGDPDQVGRFSGTPYPYTLPIGEPTERDAVVAETVIQWLGSNVGMSFLCEVFKDEEPNYSTDFPDDFKKSMNDFFSFRG